VKLFSQRSTALLAVVAFVLGMTAIPALHLAFHRLPHAHAGAEIQYHPASPGHHDEHEHDGDHQPAAASEEHHEPDHHHHHDESDDTGDRQPLDPHHGEGAAAHFALAISDSVATEFALAAEALTPAAVVTAATPPLIASTHAAVQRFRGPPRG
jgi:ABC-type Zn2+ transport system substrate-binding protein/surface adhesin